ncbi:hypothetical protein MTP99_010686 [Tenebrio molitor]|jgi:hypothetical protein|uniref:uncharacterized protein isoform X1 n=1 Tax=Tenebrio molitor TaxID=7067 RepID=UPI001C3A0A8A|nr:hypothetical protein MTP99_010686 [Tenebrio molitor]CAH1369212.1 unnamed protein product [Tenebrio molitor]
MALLNKLVYCIAISSIVRALPTTNSPKPYQTENIDDSYNPQSYSDTPAYEAFALPTNLQLPKSEPSQVPFFAPDLNTALKAPQYNSEPNYYQVPVPSQDLIAPSEKSWNPNNDPKFFYEVPASLTQQNIPTNYYPKKFNKEIHIKSKPYSSKPKQEIVLKPIDEKQFIAKQKSLNKVFDSLAKNENQKELQVPKFFAQPKLSDSRFTERFDTESVAPHGGFGKGASADLTASLGISSPLTHSSSSSAPHGERHEFHMTGHDGPHSYKWGFDTGKGHNRQFRYEERDKEGIVKGHFGFFDKLGKLQMVNYDAHPHEGYHADGNFGKF